MYSKVARTLRELGIDFSTEESVLAKYATDESVFSVMPQMVVIPHSTEEVQKIVRTVAGYTQDYPEISLTVRAAGTGLSGGSLNDSIIMDVKHLSGMEEIVKTENGGATLRVAPGTYFRDIHALVHQEGLDFPVFPSSWRICTMGGMVANNAAGPNSLKYGHTSEFVESLEVVMHDGVLNTFEPISYKKLEQELRRADSVGALYSFMWSKLQSDFDSVKRTKPDSSKNSAGYELWDVLQADSVEAFINGEGTINMIHAFCGAQGTIGIITNITIRLIEKTQESSLLVVPVYEIERLGEIIQTLLKENPYNIELFDDITYRLALKNPGFFKTFFTQVGNQGESTWLGFVYHLYKTYVLGLKMKIPKMTLMVKFDAPSQAEADRSLKGITNKIKGMPGCAAYLVTNKKEEDMFWRIRGSSYSLAKLTPEDNRPAAFLEDMVVAPEHIPAFLASVKEKLEEHKLQYAVHGHGGNGHFHFYPLFDFTDPETPERLYKIAHEFYTLAEEHEGNICGEHNDGIMRTPFLGKIFSDQEIALFEEFEHVADPEDIFNPGKKVNPKFDIRGSMRTTN